MPGKGGNRRGDQAGMTPQPIFPIVIRITGR